LRTGPSLRRRDVQRAKIGAAEGACGDVADRHLDDAVDFAVGRDPDDAAAAIARVPKIAVAVHGGAVRGAARAAGEERALVGDGAGGAVIVPDIDGVAESVAAIEELVVRAPGECVGDADTGLVGADDPVPGDAVELAGGIVGDGRFAAVGGDVVLHRADPEVAGGVWPAVIQAHAREVLQRPRGFGAGGVLGLAKGPPPGPLHSGRVRPA